MSWKDSSPDSFDAAQSLSSGLFNAAGVQVKGICGSSFITDVIKVERNGILSAVKILTPGATSDPELVSRFLTNARYNQALNEFTQMPISEIVDSGPRPYYVMDRVAQSSLQEIIRFHAPIDPLWLVTLLQPIARSLDTIHQRSVLHGNIKPSNLLVVVENGVEKMLLVDFLDPSLTATSATMTGAGIYAAPEFRMGTPVSNRSDIYSLASVMYESLSTSAPAGPYRRQDGSFHVWRQSDKPRELSQINPQIPKAVSDVIMSGLENQAISRPASASALVDDVTRLLHQPRTTIKTEPVEKQHTPVPMLLIIVGVFIASLLLLFGGFKIFSAITGSDSADITVTTITIPQDNTVTEQENSLLALVPPDQRTCQADRNEEGQRLFSLANAILNCASSDVSRLTYASFNSLEDMEISFNSMVSIIESEVRAQDKEIVRASDPPCNITSNEQGPWGDPASSKVGGTIVCVDVPHAKVIWTEKSRNIIGFAELSSGDVANLGLWWRDKAGPI